MAIDKIQSESINLADNFAFSGTVTGAGSRLNLLNTTNASSASSVIFNSSLITSTYDQYLISCPNLVVFTSTANMRMYASENNGSNTFSGFYSGTQYSQATQDPSDNSYQTDANQSYFTFLDSAMYSSGGLEDSTHQFEMILTVNYTSNNTGIKAYCNTRQIHSNGHEVAHLLSMKDAQSGGTTRTTNYIRMQASSGNISGTFKLWGIVT